MADGQTPRVRRRTRILNASVDPSFAAQAYANIAKLPAMQIEENQVLWFMSLPGLYR
jgi:hypothetical protein